MFTTAACTKYITLEPPDVVNASARNGNRLVVRLINRLAGAGRDPSAALGRCGDATTMLLLHNKSFDTMRNAPQTFECGAQCALSTPRMCCGRLGIDVEARINPNYTRICWHIHKQMRFELLLR